MTFANHMHLAHYTFNYDNDICIIIQNNKDVGPCVGWLQQTTWPVGSAAVCSASVLRWKKRCAADGLAIQNAVFKNGRADMQLVLTIVYTIYLKL